MNKEIMRRNYEKTSKETLINILISSRETIQNRDKEIVRLNNIINELKKENKQLKANWDKLKEWLESNWEESQDIWFVKIINKMQELEQGSDKE